MTREGVIGDGGVGPGVNEEVSVGKMRKWAGGGGWGGWVCGGGGGQRTKEWHKTMITSSKLV